MKTFSAKITNNWNFFRVKKPFIIPTTYRYLSKMFWPNCSSSEVLLWSQAYSPSLQTEELSFVHSFLSEVQKISQNPSASAHLVSKPWFIIGYKTGYATGGNGNVWFIFQLIRIKIFSFFKQGECRSPRGLTAFPDVNLCSGTTTVLNSFSFPSL